MTLNEIKEAVLSGKNVYWANERYKVVFNNGEFSIICDGGSTIGLTHMDNVTLNGDEQDFYIGT